MNSAFAIITKLYILLLLTLLKTSKALSFFLFYVYSVMH